MILILGGTTEGRAAARVLDEAGKPFLYSTRGSEQALPTHNGLFVQGDRDATALSALVSEYSVRLIIDAAHPFASNLHRHSLEAAHRSNIPIVRYERIFAPHSEHICYCSSYAAAIRRLQEDNIHHLLALTGVQTIELLRAYWQQAPLCRFRILDRDSSRRVALKAGFPLDRLEYFEDGADADYKLLERLRPEAIITKESGHSGFFEQKVRAAEQLGIRVYVIERPALPSGYTIVVDGQAALRRAIQTLCPDFFPERIGLTTGAAAAAATRAALLTLITDEAPEQVYITLPKTGEHVLLPISAITSDGLSATATVIKDGGDDPDATHGTEICATVSLPLDPHRSPRICIDGGVGIGRITLPGLDLPIGAAAINEMPRRMIEHEVSELLPDRSIDIVISAPQGQAIATRTFNPRLGITGGISIIGTTGVVRPFSHEAFVGSIRRSIQVAMAVGTDTVVINSGGKSEHQMRKLYPQLPPQSFVQYGNFIGATLNILHEVGAPQIVMGIMIGKAVKLAQGLIDTHSHTATMDKGYLATLAQTAGCSHEAVVEIGFITLARELLTRLSKADCTRLLDAILARCYAVCQPLAPQASLSIHLIR